MSASSTKHIFGGGGGGDSDATAATTITSTTTSKAGKKKAIMKRKTSSSTSRNLKWQISRLQCKSGQLPMVARASKTFLGKSAVDIIMEKSTTTTAAAMSSDGDDDDNNDDDVLSAATTTTSLVKDMDTISSLMAEKQQHIIHHSGVELRRVIKKLRTFEVRRLTRTIMEAKKMKENGEEKKEKAPPKDITKIEAVLVVLKSLDLESFALKIMERIQYGKKKKLTDSDGDVDDEAVMSAKARLLSRQPLKDAIETIKQRLNVDQATIGKSRAEKMAETQQEHTERRKTERQKKKERKKEHKRMLAEEADDGNTQPKSKKEKRLNSTFIISLSGEAVDEGDSDSDDENDHNSDVNRGNEYSSGGNDKPVKKKVTSKKNRLGQRARRQQHEELYGRNAKHVKASRELKAKEKEQIIKDAVVKANLEATGIDETAHPSWVAAQKRKAEANKIVFEGKKIKFDD